MSAKQRPDYYIDGMAVPEVPGPGEEPAPWVDTHTVGKASPRVDAYERVSGAAMYPSDVSLPGMLHGAILGCPHAHAKVRKLDPSRAATLPGVHAVLTAKSPGADRTWYYRGDKSCPLFDPHCRFEGDAVAAVAAETPYQAADALAAVEVDYQVLPATTDYLRALDSGAAPVHAGGNRVAEDEVYQRGDVAKGFAAADAVVERTFRTACELHTPLEPHGCVAAWDGERLTIWESTQGVFRVQAGVARVLGMPLSRVRVIGHYMGGGFGSKLWAGKYTVIAALLAKRTARPVRLFLSREQTYLVAGNRPANRMHLKAGVNKDGSLTALQLDCSGPSGAYPGGGSALVDWQIRDLYTCPNVQTRSTDVYIHSGPARPFRGPGHPQGSFALEQVMDELAAKIGMDPVELRSRNIPSVSQAREGTPPYTSSGLKRCLEQGAEAFGWKRADKKSGAEEKRLRRGVGMAACVWVAGGGGPPSTVVVKLFADGSANLNMGASDIGTGTKTIMAGIVSEELGVRPELIQIEHADTGTTQFATPSGGSKTVPTESPAVRAAAIAVKRELLALAAEELGVPAAKLRLIGGRVESRDGKTAKAIRELERLAARGVLVGVGTRGPNPEGKVVNPYGAQFCEVEVDTLTGEVRILRFVAAHESGRVMNRLTFDNQVAGGVTMGIGFGATEERILDRNTGKLCTHNWHDYKLPTALDAPAELRSVPIDAPDPLANSAGAKGLGEPVTIPTAAALANAIFDATGARPTEAPITPARVLTLLAGRDGKEG